MLAHLYTFTRSEEKILEPVVDDPTTFIAHGVLLPGDEVPRHETNANIYMIITTGTIDLTLNEEAAQTYPCGSIINIPANTMMYGRNSGSDKLEFFIIKSPNPGAHSTTPTK